jgi:hypothetical protein
LRPMKVIIFFVALYKTTEITYLSMTFGQADESHCGRQKVLVFL